MSYLLQKRKFSLAMAEDFENWLKGTIYNLKAYSDSKIFVVGLVGKDTTENSKVDALNEFLQRPIFQGTWIDKESPVFIEAFFSVEDLTLFLVLNGVNESDAITHLFVSGKFQDKNFFEKLSLLEYEYVHRLHLLFVLCHAVIFVEQGCRFDIAVAKYLKNVNQLRLQSQDKIIEALSKLSNIPREWRDEGRLAMPRACFGFYRNPLRADLGALKKKELIDKMQKHLSGQIYSILKQSHVIETHAGSSLCSLSDNDVPFVHIFRSNEAPIDYLHELVTAMVIEDRTPDFCKFNYDDGRDCYEKKRNSENIEDFGGFLRALIDDSLEIGDRSDVFFKFPKLKHFIEGATAVYEILVTTPPFSDNELKGMFLPELTMVESLDDAILRSAIAFYRKDLEETTRPHEAANRGYSKKEHVEKLQQAVNYLRSHVTGDNLQKFMESLTEQCNQIWLSGHQRCETISLTGSMCRYSIKKHPTIELSNFSKFGSKMDDDKENLVHSSGIRFLSTCNCGRTQTLRNDPFNLKEANFDFFEQFHCCKNAERYEFPIFEPKGIEEASQDVEEDEEEEAENSASEDDETSSNETEETATSEDEENTRLRTPSSRMKKTSSGASSPKDDDFDHSKEVIADADDSRMEYHSRYLDEEKLMQMIGGKEKKGRRRVRKSESERQSDEEDEQDEEHVEEKSEEDEEATEEKHDDESEEEELEEEEKDFEPEKQPSEATETDTDGPVGDYLDTYDANLKVNLPKETIKTDDSSKEYNEVSKRYKGHYLEHLPHSSITSGLVPLFPSWAVVCVGPSSLYCHASGLRDQPNFKAGSEYLLPLDIHLNVVSEQWEADMRKIAPTSERNYRRTPRRRLDEDPLAGTNREKVKFFIGFDYECPRGHRFMITEPNKVLRHRRSNGHLKETANNLVKSDIPIWMPCTCKREPLVAAQLMRLHIVTPKAPVMLTLNPRVVIEPVGYFHMGDSDVDLTWAKYYVLRFPYVYVGPNGPFYPPKTAQIKGKLLKNCFTVAHTSLQ